tara:strand:+ start:215 stop:796 length:582 start_codon:yes stop_codon:yes gene_type:complete
MKKDHGLYKFNKRTGYWDHKRSVSPENKDQWLDIFKKDDPEEHFITSKNRPKHNPLKEDAPANGAGGGAIAGIGIGPKGEPGITPRMILRRKAPIALQEKSEPNPIVPTQAVSGYSESSVKKGRFAGNDTFIVPSDTFFRARNEKKKGKHWKTYIGEDEHGMYIREYAKKNQKHPIILQCERTGAMHYARYGK